MMPPDARKLFHKCWCGRLPLVNDGLLHDVWSAHCSDLGRHGRVGASVRVDWGDIDGTYRRLADAWNGKVENRT